MRVWRHCQGHLDINLCHKVMLAVQKNHPGHNFPHNYEIAILNPSSFHLVEKRSRASASFNRKCSKVKSKDERISTKDESWVPCGYIKGVILPKLFLCLNNVPFLPFLQVSLSIEKKKVLNRLFVSKQEANVPQLFSFHYSSRSGCCSDL